MDPCYMGAAELAAAIADGRISATEALDTCLARVEAYNPAINAIVETDVEPARAAARAADEARAAGETLGPLHGVPMTVKDSFDLASLPSTFGRPERRDHQAPRDALAVERLKAAGAIVFGKTNVPKDLADWQSYNEIHGDTVNPWDASRTPGGSSGGAAAALAAGMVALEFGSDIGGSIRIPAHCCGVYGHKPTFGIVPLRGHAFSPDDADSDILVGGPLARSAQDLALALDLAAGADPEAGSAWRLDLPDEPRDSLRGFRIAVVTNDERYPVDADTRAALNDAADFLAAEGADVVRDPALPMPSEELWRLYLDLLRGATSVRLTDEEASAAAARAAATDPDDLGYGAVMLRALGQSHHRWLRANDRRSWLRNRWREFFGEVDALVTPMMATAAFPHIRGIAKQDQQLDVDGVKRPIADTYYWIGLASVTGLPATVAPAGASRDGLPIGLQIVGPEFHDRRCIKLAGFLERGFRKFAPPPEEAQLRWR
jgi:amidase